MRWHHTFTWVIVYVNSDVSKLGSLSSVTKPTVCCQSYQQLTKELHPISWANQNTNSYISSMKFISHSHKLNKNPSRFHAILYGMETNSFFTGDTSFETFSVTMQGSVSKLKDVGAIIYLFTSCTTYLFAYIIVCDSKVVRRTQWLTSTLIKMIKTRRKCCDIKLYIYWWVMTWITL